MTRTPAEVQAIVERVVVEHWQGWHIRSRGFGVMLEVAAPPDDVACDVNAGVGQSGKVYPRIAGWSDKSCARAVALWPEMQRLCAMLREALK